MTKRLFIKTYGCQMNVYDSARMADLMAPLGYAPATSPECADLVILNTCHIREKAAEKVFSELGGIRRLKEARARRGGRMMIAVAGCVAQAEGEEILRRAPFVDLVFGPQTYHRLPEMVARAERAAGNGILDTSFPIESKFDYLPESELPRVRNLEDFARVLVFDKWLCNSDGRQAIFHRVARQRGYHATFIDHGYCFNAGEWNFPDSPLRGMYAHRVVYQNISGWDSFEPWLSRIENFPFIELGAIAEDVPPEWIEPDEIYELLERIDSRRSRVRELIAEVRKSTHNPFSAWIEEKP